MPITASFEHSLALISHYFSLIKGLAVALTSQGTPNVEIRDCLDCYTSTLQEGGLDEVGKYPVFGASGIVGYTDVSMVSGGAILIIKDGSGVGTVSYVAKDCAVLGTLNYLTSKCGYNLRYLYYALMFFNFKPYKTGMAIPHIYFKDYGRAKIWCPNLIEQKRIASALASIEDKLRIESQLLVNLQAQKIYLLSKLFI